MKGEVFFMYYTLKIGDTVEVYGTEAARNKRKRQLEFLEMKSFSDFDSIVNKYNGLNISVRPAGGGFTELSAKNNKSSAAPKTFYLVKLKKKGSFIFTDKTLAYKCCSVISSKSFNSGLIVVPCSSKAQLKSSLGKTPVLYSDYEISEVNPAFNDYQKALNYLFSLKDTKVTQCVGDYFSVKVKGECLFILNNQKDAEKCDRELRQINKKSHSKNRVVCQVYHSEEQILNSIGNIEYPVCYNGTELSGIKSTVNSYQEALDAFYSLAGIRKSDDVVPASSNVKTAKYTFFCDGAYSAKSNRAGAGVVILTGPDVIVEKHSEEVHDKEFKLMRNVSGELASVFYALEYIKRHKIKSADIYVDYQGLIKWANKEWTPTKLKTKEYVELVDEVRKNCTINFIKVKSHSGDKYNDVADKLAKRAVGI